jgi:hypothetical protein
MMLVYVPRYGAFARGYFDGCFSDRTEASCSSWMVPGTWPDWAL